MEWIGRVDVVSIGRTDAVENILKGCIELQWTLVQLFTSMQYFIYTDSSILTLNTLRLDMEAVVHCVHVIH